MTIPMTIYATIAIGISSSLIVLARRYKNTDDKAGEAIAGWSIFLIIIIWISII